MNAFSHVLLVALMIVSAGSHGAVLTGKTNFWKNLEAGKPQKISFLGSSLSKGAHCAEDVARELSDRFPVLVTKTSYAEDGASTAGILSKQLAPCLADRPDVVSFDTRFDIRAGVTTKEGLAQNIVTIIDKLREALPNVEILLYETTFIKCSGCSDEALIEDYINAVRQVAYDKGTYLVRTSDRFKSYFIEYCGQNGEHLRQDDMYVYIMDGRHPSFRGKHSIMVPTFMRTLSGETAADVVNGKPILDMPHIGGHRYYVGEEISFEFSQDIERTGGVDAFVCWYSGIGDCGWLPLSGVPDGAVVNGNSLKWKIPVKLGSKSCAGNQYVTIQLRARKGDHYVTTGLFGIVAPTPALSPLRIQNRWDWFKSFAVKEQLTFRWQYTDKTREPTFRCFFAIDGTTFSEATVSPVTGNEFHWRIPQTIDGKTVADVKTAALKVQSSDGQSATAGGLSIRRASTTPWCIKSGAATLTAGRGASSRGRSMANNAMALDNGGAVAAFDIRGRCITGRSPRFGAPATRLVVLVNSGREANPRLAVGNVR